MGGVLLVVNERNDVFRIVGMICSHDQLLIQNLSKGENIDKANQIYYFTSISEIVQATI